MDKTYSPKDIEENLYQEWEEKGYFKPSGEGQPYSIMIPPPNVTGSLHMGHAFQHTIMDTLTRYQRMDGKNTLWQVGSDHAGIATQMVVERQLAAQGQSRQDLGRDAFIDKVWEWKEQSGGTITSQMRRLGDSVDWDRERFTMDEGLSKAVLEVFVQLYKEGLIYRGKRLVNWDPKLQTAISDLKLKIKNSKALFGICAIRWRTAQKPMMVKTIWWLPQRVQKPCWAMFVLRCTRTTSAISIWSVKTLSA